MIRFILSVFLNTAAIPVIRFPARFSTADSPVHYFLITVVVDRWGLAFLLRRSGISKANTNSKLIMREITTFFFSKRPYKGRGPCKRSYLPSKYIIYFKISTQMYGV